MLRKNTARTRLAVYGTLAPGEINHHQLAGLKGSWRRGWVVGTLREIGRGAAQGLPGLSLDPNGPEVEVQVFQSDQLPMHWRRLDKFEGREYRRHIVLVRIGDGYIEANIYALAY